MTAIKLRDYEAIFAAISSGRDLNKPDDECNTPLIWAARTAQPSILFELLEAGVAWTPRNIADRDAWDYVKERIPTVLEGFTERIGAIRAQIGVAIAAGRFREAGLMLDRRALAPDTRLGPSEEDTAVALAGRAMRMVSYEPEALHEFLAARADAGARVGWDAVARAGARLEDAESLHLALPRLLGSVEPVLVAALKHTQSTFALGVIDLAREHRGNDQLGSAVIVAAADRASEPEAVDLIEQLLELDVARPAEGALEIAIARHASGEHRGLSLIDILDRAGLAGSVTPTALARAAGIVDEARAGALVMRLADLGFPEGTELGSALSAAAAHYLSGQHTGASVLSSLVALDLQIGTADYDLIVQRALAATEAARGTRLLTIVAAARPSGWEASSAVLDSALGRFLDGTDPDGGLALAVLPAQPSGPSKSVMDALREAMSAGCGAARIAAALPEPSRAGLRRFSVTEPSRAVIVDLMAGCPNPADRTTQAAIAALIDRHYGFRHQREEAPPYTPGDGAFRAAIDHGTDPLAMLEFLSVVDRPLSREAVPAVCAVLDRPDREAALARALESLALSGTELGKAYGCARDLGRLSGGSPDARRASVALLARSGVKSPPEEISDEIAMIARGGGDLEVLETLLGAMGASSHLPDIQDRNPVDALIMSLGEFPEILPALHLVLEAGLPGTAAEPSDWGTRPGSVTHLANALDSQARLWQPETTPQNALPSLIDLLEASGIRLTEADLVGTVIAAPKLALIVLERLDETALTDSAKRKVLSEALEGMLDLDWVSAEHLAAVDQLARRGARPKQYLLSNTCEWGDDAQHILMRHFSEDVAAACD